MEYLYLKAVHIIFVVTWFSGMFYLVRLFVYQREAHDKPATEKAILQPQFDLMSKRLLYGITLPSAVLTFLLGLRLFWLYPTLPTWLLIKIALVALLFLYHASLHIIYEQQKKRDFRFSSTQLRIWNEVPTVLLVAIVMLVVVKQNISLVYGLIGLLGLVVVLLVAIRLYKIYRSSVR